MATSGEKGTAQLRLDYGWAVAILRKHFSRGLHALAAPAFLRERYQRFLSKGDPIYTALLQGMGEDALATTFVSYWTIAQTLATQSRFWLEDAIAELLIHTARTSNNVGLRVYTRSMLSDGWLQRGVTVADLGEEDLEHLLQRRSWRVRLQGGALAAIDAIVGEQERQRPASNAPPSRSWDRRHPDVVARDLECLRQVAASVGDPPVSEVLLQCNLMVIEPDPRDGAPHAWAFRFVNPKTISSHAVRKQERVNLLRLYALMVQEKILRDARQIEVRLAELMPRYSEHEAQDPHPDYFSSATYQSYEDFWDFVGVPFGAVVLAMRDSATGFHDELVAGLRTLLPAAGDDQRFASARERLDGILASLDRALEGALLAMGVVDMPPHCFNTWDKWALFSESAPVSKEHEGTIGRLWELQEAIALGRSSARWVDAILAACEASRAVIRFVTDYAVSADMLPELKARYPGQLRADIASVRIVQKRGAVYLEIVVPKRVGDSPEELVTRSDLGFISDGYSDQPCFSPAQTAADNATKFLEQFDAIDIGNCSDLFA